MRTFLWLLLCVLPGLASTQADTAWYRSQLERITWQRSYQGVLAEYHPIRITLATDRHLLAGILVHAGESEVHRLVGDWSDSRRFLLQERDQDDRLTGYLRGEVTEDHVDMEWISADQSRAFRIRAVPDQLIRIGGFRPVSEWIDVNTEPGLAISVQKMDYGIISGLVIRDGVVSRFEGQCQDGQCSIWNATVAGPDGTRRKLSMRQRSATTYLVGYDGREMPGTITSTFPLKVESYCNRAGFLDLVYPDFPGKSYAAWLARVNAGFWPDELERLKTLERVEPDSRLAYRVSGWVEVLEANEDVVSGVMTIALPGKTRREPFLWLRREDEVMTGGDWLNLPSQQREIDQLALQQSRPEATDAFHQWIRSSGYVHSLPTRFGLLALTDFHRVFGDDMTALPFDQVRGFVRKKYWKYFNWPNR